MPSKEKTNKQTRKNNKITKLGRKKVELEWTVVSLLNTKEKFLFLFFIFFYFILFYFIITLGIHLQYSYTVLTYNKTTKFTYVTALLLTCLLLTYIKIPKTSLQQTKGLLKTINK